MWKKVRQHAGAIAMGVVCLAASVPAHADNYPSQAIKLTVVYQPGGANDIVARVLGDRMSQAMGQPFMVVNRPGANGAIGAQAVANSPADGYNVLMGGAPLVVAKALYKQPKVDFERDFAPVGKAVNLNLVLVARKDFAATTFQQLVDMERKKPGSTSMAITASVYEFYWARINLLTQMDLLKVPYPGVPAAMTDLKGGRVDLLIDTLAAQRAFLANGDTKPLAVFGKQRLADLPNVPTLSELGLKQFEDQPFIGMLVPKKTPETVILKLNKALNEALDDPAVKTKLTEIGFEVSAGSPQSFLKEMRDDSNKFVEVGAAAGIEKQ